MNIWAPKGKFIAFKKAVYKVCPLKTAFATSRPSLWEYFRCCANGGLPSLKLTLRTWNDGIPKGKDHLPTINFHLSTVSDIFFWGGIYIFGSHSNHGGSSKVLGKNAGWSFVIPPRTWGIAVYPLGVISDELCSFIDELTLSSLDHQAPLLNDQKRVGLLSTNQFLGHFFFQQSSFVSNNKLIWTFPNSSHFDSFVFFFQKCLMQNNINISACAIPRKGKSRNLTAHMGVIVRETPKCPEDFRFRNRKHWVRWSDPNHSTRFSSFTKKLPTWKMGCPFKGAKLIFHHAHRMTWKAKWWFQIFFNFIPTCGRFPFWLIFFKWVETTS